MEVSNTWKEKNGTAVTIAQQRISHGSEPRRIKKMRIACSEENCTCVGFVGRGKLGTKEVCSACGHESRFHDDIFETTEDSLARLVDRFVVEMARKDARIRELEIELGRARALLDLATGGPSHDQILPP